MKWAHLPQYRDKKAIICDGSVRSGKTVSMIIGFVHWAMRFFDGKNFGICGKTVSSTERNIITPLLSMVDITDYYDVTYRRGDSLLTIRDGEKVNRFYVFGGKEALPLLFRLTCKRKSYLEDTRGIHLQRYLLYNLMASFRSV